MAGGVASVTTYDKQVLLKAVLDGDINLGESLRQVINWKILIRLIKIWIRQRKSIKSMIVLD